MSTTTQSKRPLVLVTGANGQLGKELRQLETKWPEFEFLFLSREDLPIHHFELVRNFFKATHPSFLINCAAYTAVDKAEQEEELAFQINAEAVGVLAAICKEQDCKFVHVSTDYVFDGLANRPYREDDLTNPQGVYGASKLAGEKEAVLLNPDSVIIRTSWVYSSFGKNFVKTILRLLQEKPSVSVVDDQIGSPTYAADLAVAILEIISLKSWKPGVYHFSNEGEISWCAFAKAIAALTHSNTPVQAITTAEFPTPAKRPAWSVLDKSKIKAVYGIKIRPWKESLADCLELLSK
ncbi:MAG: dTDP-4-dehydrorhamnose reductase [Chitinophagaceae bacterium]|nr:dTDP-4-dehydrorhamnose reductase [Chitinophagaceae bacterium]NCW87337.1 dTDP-4-dehydrorhamnose reductase [Chitinophagia bacterium]NDB52713.1 dTDP-4-dehydrorhamnose reductase [Chitinophagaceae bacterium]NDE77989.1 dTDP-4-dehydrorhamnose reductase [Chitinophagaceae bacterium]HAL94896.1 dTDP-4-dehydrorhamnose reductase [Chitinophagaceae bacterium]